MSEIPSSKDTLLKIVEKTEKEQITSKDDLENEIRTLEIAVKEIGKAADEVFSFGRIHLKKLSVAKEDIAVYVNGLRRLEIGPLGVFRLPVQDPERTISSIEIALEELP